MFTKNSKALLFGLQIGAAQHMLDFDFLCGRSPSVSAFINPGKKMSSHKLFFGDKEVLIPSYPDFEHIPEHIGNEVDTLVNFASFRSAFLATKLALESELFENIIIIAEGIPERQTRELIALNTIYKKNIVGPATVGAMEAGVFRAGNTGGALENIIASRLYQSGSVGFVSKSGGMSNELRRVISDRTNGTSLSIALGGDKYNIMTFPDAMKIMEKRDDVKMIVMLGEVGGRDELKIADMIKSGEITKPVVAWCIGTIGEQIGGEVQFGHAGAKSNQEEETANYKNTALKEAGAVVPESYMDFGEKIEETFLSFTPPLTPPLSGEGNSKCSTSSPLGRGLRGGQSGEKDNKSKTPLLLQEKGLGDEVTSKLLQIKSRKATNFTSTISDERGEELLYNGKKISTFIEKGSIANVISNLWLKKDLPDYGEKFINTILILLADHGPAVSGATNAIVTARAGNDLKSSLISGLTTIGPRFGGAIDGAAKYFSQAVEGDENPGDFVMKMKKMGINIPGIGHKVKSKFNPDKRCEILLKIAENFPSTPHLDFAREVEKITLEKKPNLILNVDGMTAVLMLDLFNQIGLTKEEINMYIEAGIFNGFFILARSIGFIGHILDQKRLAEGLYRTPWNDILYKN